MIWDDIRKQSPLLHDPAIQVVKVPFTIFTSWESGKFTIEPKEIIKAYDLIPRNKDGSPDMSWVKYPFRTFVLIDGTSRAAILCHNEDGAEGEAAWRSDTALVTESKHGVFGILAAHYFIFQNGEIRSEIDRDESAFSDATKAMGLPALTLDAISGDTYKVLVDQMGAYATAAMALMSCKNVTTVEHHPPRQQRRLAERKSLLPPVSWHELVIGHPTERSTSEKGDGHPIALHWVRGHFADHRTKGLFGKHKGVFWWSPHLAGRADRVVLKDYVLRDPNQPTAERESHQ